MSAFIFTANVRDTLGDFISFSDVVQWGKEWYSKHTQVGDLGEYQFLGVNKECRMVITEEDSPEGDIYNIFTVTAGYPFPHFACAMNDYIDRFSPRDFFWGTESDSGLSESRPNLSEYIHVFGASRNASVFQLWRRLNSQYTDWHNKGGAL